MERPSNACLILPVPSAQAIPWLDRGLRARRLLRHDAPPPRGYPTRQDEWLGFVLSPLGDDRTLVLLSDLDAVFRVALWLTAAEPSADVLAWRQYRGLPPTLKLYGDARPVWKDGEDDDHEVMWHVPGFDSDVDAARLREAGLPGRAAEVRPLIGSALRPYREAITAPLPGESRVGWLAGSSALAR